MAAPNPLELSYSSHPPAVSKRAFTISGILTAVFGLDELPPDVSDVCCLWLIHPRQRSMADMDLIAYSVLGDYTKNTSRKPAKGLIGVAFDQRNHGSREVDPLVNEAWRGGNERHAQDMFSIYQGAAIDTSQLMDYISAYAFPRSERRIVDHLVLGVSLGGHAAWHCILHDPRVSAAIIIIGCPDFTKLLSDRARLSKRRTWTKSDPPGSQFLGSEDFPSGLMEAVSKWDPRAFLFGPLNLSTEAKTLSEPSAKEKIALLPLLNERLGGKRILNISGGRDKMVPYRCSEPFLTWLKKGISPGGWYRGRPVLLDDMIFEDAGHEFTPAMTQEVVKFVAETLSSADTPSTTAEGRVRSFKM